jgi:hypothetical protein
LPHKRVQRAAVGIIQNARVRVYHDNAHAPFGASPAYVIAQNTQRSLLLKAVESGARNYIAHYRVKRLNFAYAFVDKIIFYKRHYGEIKNKQRHNA